MTLADYLVLFALTCACIGGIFAVATILALRRDSTKQSSSEGLPNTRSTHHE